MKRARCHAAFEALKSRTQPLHSRPAISFSKTQHVALLWRTERAPLTQPGIRERKHPRCAERPADEDQHAFGELVCSGARATQSVGF